MLAGLITDEDRRTATRVPGLGDLPVLGRLFSVTKDTTSQDRACASHHAAARAHVGAAGRALDRVRRRHGSLDRRRAGRAAHRRALQAAAAAVAGAAQERRPTTGARREPYPAAGLHPAGDRPHDAGPHQPKPLPGPEMVPFGGVQPEPPKP